MKGYSLKYVDDKIRDIFPLLGSKPKKHTCLSSLECMQEEEKNETACNLPYSLEPS